MVEMTRSQEEFIILAWVLGVSNKQHNNQTWICLGMHDPLRNPQGQPAITPPPQASRDLSEPCILNAIEKDFPKILGAIVPLALILENVAI